jgi:hypothetical protein
MAFGTVGTPDLSTPVTGTLFFVPTADFLDESTDAASGYLRRIASQDRMNARRSVLMASA